MQCITHACPDVWRKLDNLLLWKRVLVRCLQIVVITSHGLRTDAMWLSNSCKFISTHTKRTISHGFQYVSDTIMIATTYQTTE